jgi:multicomponent Na+:H+ antiporter subunit C
VQTLLAIVVGVVYAASIYLMLRRSIVKLALGLALFGHASNLLIFTAGGLTRGRPPIVPPDASIPDGAVADPLPHALILTAIVIGFGVLAFSLVLVHRTYQSIGQDDLDHMVSADT